MFEHLSYDSIKLTLQEITRLILYTDGISDQIFAKEIDPGLFKEVSIPSGDEPDKYFRTTTA